MHELMMFIPGIHSLIDFAFNLIIVQQRYKAP